jgi:hypothetical protein
MATSTPIINQYNFNSHCTFEKKTQVITNRFGREIKNTFLFFSDARETLTK